MVQIRIVERAGFLQRTRFMLVRIVNITKRASAPVEDKRLREIIVNYHTLDEQTKDAIDAIIRAYRKKSEQAPYTMLTL